MLLDAIKHSRMALILFSTNYADSSWCLDELVEIMNCHDKYKDLYGHMIFPVFYNVEPSDVRYQRGAFGEGYRRCIAKYGTWRDVKWREALARAGDVSGWALNDQEESTFIKHIVEEIGSRVTFVNSPYFVDNPMGRESIVDDIVSFMMKNDDAVSVIGIHGIQGIGKTTLAKIICSHVYVGFGSISFHKNIGESTEQGLVDRQNKLANDLKLKPKQLCDKKVLVVLDDVIDKKQVMALCGERHRFGPGSRIIITTRDEQLLDQLNVDKKYMVPVLGWEESLQLFNHVAFDKSDNYYKQKSDDVVYYTRGYPLAIKAVGAAVAEEEDKEKWFYKTLQKLVENPSFGSVWNDLIRPKERARRIGGDGGSHSYDDSGYTGVRKIVVVVVSSMVESIQIDYDRSGALERSRRYGGSQQGHTIEVKFDYPKEYMTSISGYVLGNSAGIFSSLLIRSNERDYGPYGEEKGKQFSINPKTGEKVVGLFGKYGCNLDSVGLYLRPINYSSPYHSSDRIGPFGTHGPIVWDHGKHQDIRHIDLVFDDLMIHGMDVVYDNFGHPLVPFTHGTNSGTSGTKSVKVALQYPYEYVTSISGFTSSDPSALRSLTIHTNKRSYGPYGGEVGNPFVGPTKGTKIVGFFGGRESIGAYIEPISHIYPFKGVGLYGGDGNGSAWDDGIKYTGLRQIVLRSGAWIDSVRFVYIDQDGVRIEKSRHGGQGRNAHTVNLDPDEYLIRLSGHYETRDTPHVVKSLTFHSNKRRYGPYGNQEGTYFMSPPNLGKIVGFYGRSGEFLVSIGAYFAPIFHEHPLEKIEPFGSDGGVDWDDGRHSHITHIYVSHGLVVNGIRCGYSDTNWLSEVLHGGRGSWYTVELDYPNEYVVAMSGYVGRFDGLIVVKSLTFRTNRNKTHGPIGLEEGTPFSFATNKGKFVGFHGRSGIFLDAIGPHVEIVP